MEICFTEILKTYQTLIVGVLGFTGVIVTLRENSKLQRRQLSSKLKHDADSLRTALKSELNANRRAFETRLEQFNEPVEYEDALLQNRTNDTIYKELLKDIGKLSEHEIEKIIEAYSILSEVPYRIRILVGTDRVGGFNNEFIRVPNSHQEIVAGLHKQVVPIIDEAISAINANLKSA